MAITGGPDIVENGLVLYLDAGNTKSYSGSGTIWSDLSGNGNNGTLVNAITFDSGNLGSIVFDTNEYITASPLPSGTNLFTYSIWLYLEANWGGNFGGTNYATALLSGNATGTAELLLLTEGAGIGPPYSLSFSRYGGGTVGSCTATNINMPRQRWHNVVLVRDGSASQKLYLNGDLLTTGNVSNSFNSGTLHVARAPAVSSFSAQLNGKISSIFLYNRGLSTQEVQQNFNATRSRFGL